MNHQILKQKFQNHILYDCKFQLKVTQFCHTFESQVLALFLYCLCAWYSLFISQFLINQPNRVRISQKGLISVLNYWSKVNRYITLQVMEAMKKSEHKRIQSPPGIKLDVKTFLRED